MKHTKLSILLFMLIAGYSSTETRYGKQATMK